MLIIGLDYHPSFQQMAFLDNETGEWCVHKDLDRADIVREAGFGARRPQPPGARTAITAGGTRSSGLPPYFPVRRNGPQ
jgi:hypothetical protein